MLSKHRLKKGLKTLEAALSPIISRIESRLPGQSASLKRVIYRSPSFVVNNSPINEYCYEKSLELLEAHQRGEETRDDVLLTAYSFDGIGLYGPIYPVQHPGELSTLLEILESYSPETIVEIGTDRGGTLYTWARWLDSNRIISVDLDYNHSYLSPWTLPDRTKIFQHFADVEMYFIEGDSQDDDVKKEIEERASGSVDFLFIDGDHSYDAVKSDFETYVRFVSDGGIVALHDVREEDCGVPSLWEEIEDRYETEVIYSEDPIEIGGKLPDRRREKLEESGGIGVVYL